MKTRNYENYKTSASGHKIWPFIVGGFAILATATCMYFAMRNGPDNPNEPPTNTPVVVIDSNYNSKIEVIYLNNSTLNISGSYHVGNNSLDSLYLICPSKKVTHTPINRKEHLRKSNHELDCCGSEDLFQDNYLPNN